MAVRHNDGPVRAMSTDTNIRPNRTWATGRTCRQAGCSTALSIYNRSATCSLHEETRVYVHRGRRRARTVHKAA